ncbi:UNVERIFIED_ORG: hypothetical protein J3D59_004722 [Pseudomonas fluorescens]
MIKIFMFSYSVKVKRESEAHEKIAQAVRAKIATIPNIDWTKLDKVETTIKGLISISGDSLEAKRKCAQHIVNKELALILEEVGREYPPRIHVALIVDGLGDVILFEVE